MLGALCYVCVPNIDKLTSQPLQLELGEPAPVLEPLKFVSGECSTMYRQVCIDTVFFRLSAHDELSAQRLFYTVRRGMASATVAKNLVKLPPRRIKKSEITDLSSCRVCKPALNSAISALLLSLCIFAARS